MTAAWREFLALGVLVALWYATLSGLQPATCFDGDCGGWTGVALTLVLPAGSLALTAALAARFLGPKAPVGFARLGLSSIEPRSVAAAVGFVALAGLVFPVTALALQQPLVVSDVWPWRLAGALAINGLAEEAMMRGFVFQRFRQRSPFWHAATATTVLFAGYHLPIILSEGALVGAVSVLLAVPIGYVTAYLYELGRGSLWGPVLLHAAYNGLVFVLSVPGAYQTFVTTTYIAAGAVIAAVWMVLAYRRGFGRHGTAWPTQPVA